MPDPRARERIGYALRALAADLVSARRQVLILRRENRELRAKLAALQATSEPEEAPHGEHGEADSRSRRSAGP